MLIQPASSSCNTGCQAPCRGHRSRPSRRVLQTVPTVARTTLRRSHDCFHDGDRPGPTVAAVRLEVDLEVSALRPRQSPDAGLKPPLRDPSSPQSERAEIYGENMDFALVKCNEKCSVTPFYFYTCFMVFSASSRLRKAGMYYQLFECDVDSWAGRKPGPCGMCLLLFGARWPSRSAAPRTPGLYSSPV